MFKPKATQGQFEITQAKEQSTITIMGKDLDAAGFGIQKVATGEKSKLSVDLVNARASCKASPIVNVYTVYGGVTGLRATVTRNALQADGQTVERMCITVIRPETGTYATIYASFHVVQDLDSQVVFSAVANATQFNALDENVEARRTQGLDGAVYSFTAPWAHILDGKRDELLFTGTQTLRFEAPETDLAINYTANGNESIVGVDFSGDYVRNELTKDIPTYDENGRVEVYTAIIKKKAFKRTGIVSNKVRITLLEPFGSQLMSIGGYIIDTSKASTWHGLIYSTQQPTLLRQVVKVKYNPGILARGGGGMYQITLVPNGAVDVGRYPYTLSKPLYVSPIDAEEVAFKSSLTSTSFKAQADEKLAGLSAIVSQSAPVPAYGDNDIISKFEVAVSGNSYNNVSKKLTRDLALSLNNAVLGNALDNRIVNQVDYYGVAAGFHVPFLVTDEYPIYSIVSDSTDKNGTGGIVRLSYTPDSEGKVALKILPYLCPYYCN